LQGSCGWHCRRSTSALLGWALAFWQPQSCSAGLPCTASLPHSAACRCDIDLIMHTVSQKNPGGFLSNEKPSYARGEQVMKCHTCVVRSSWLPHSVTVTPPRQQKAKCTSQSKAVMKAKHQLINICIEDMPGSMQFHKATCDKATCEQGCS